MYISKQSPSHAIWPWLTGPIGVHIVEAWRLKWLLRRCREHTIGTHILQYIAHLVVHIYGRLIVYVHCHLHILALISHLCAHSQSHSQVCSEIICSSGLGRWWWISRGLWLKERSWGLLHHHRLFRWNIYLWNALLVWYCSFLRISLKKVSDTSVVSHLLHFMTNTIIKGLFVSTDFAEHRDESFSSILIQQRLFLILCWRSMIVPALP